MQYDPCQQIADSADSADSANNRLEARNFFKKMEAPFLEEDSADSADKGSDPYHMILVSRLRIVQRVQIVRIIDQRLEISLKKWRHRFLRQIAQIVQIRDLTPAI